MGWLRVLILFLLAGGVHGAHAADMVVDLELVLAVDASDSMDDVERSLQREGYVAAFHDAGLVDAMLDGPLGRIAVTYVEWGDSGLVEVIQPWTVIASHGDAVAFAERLARARRFQFTKTAIGDALWFCRSLFAGNGLASDRRVIDLSGDGPSNLGRPVAMVRDLIVAEGILINGLPIMVDLESPRGPFGLDFDRRNLDRYFAECVIGGPGAFALPVYDAAAFGDAIRRKLSLEVAGIQGAQWTLAVADVGSSRPPRSRGCG